MRYAVALSGHPDAATAVGEVVGQVMDRLGPSPDVAMLFISPSHLERAADIAGTVLKTLAPGHLLGCSAGAVLAQRQEVEQAPGLVLWVGRTGPARMARLEGGRLPVDLAAGSSVLLVADPFGFDADVLFDSIPPDVTVVGGLASAAGLSGGNRLLLDDDVFSDGAVAMALPPGLGARPVVSQGCRPVGDPFVVTGMDGDLVLTLGGQPALRRIREVLAALPEADGKRPGIGLQVGIVINENRSTFGTGDFLVRGVLGADRDSGAVAIDARVEVGTTLQFQVRDAASASRDLASTLRHHRAQSALVFTCNGRGSHLFGHAGHDAGHFVDRLGTTDVAGMHSAGEIGPVGGRHHLHAFTASALLLGTDGPGDDPNAPAMVAEEG